MRILLMQSYLGRKEKINIFPLGLSYMATGLGSHTLKALDLNIEDNYRLAIKKCLTEFKPEIIGISLRNLDTTKEKDIFNYYIAFASDIEFIKKAMPGVILAVGGAGFSIYAETIMKRHPEIDFGIYMEGEESFPELIDNLADPSSVKGIFFRKNGNVHFTGQRPLLNFKSLPMPKYDLFPVKQYTNTFRFQFGVQSKRGCPLQCAYCSYPILEGHAYRQRDAKNVVDEIEHLVNTYNAHSFVFVDGVFNIPKDHAIAICTEIIKRGLNIQWWAYFNERFVDEDFIELAKKSGCTTLSYSPDAYGDKPLKILRKNINTADIKRVFNLAKKTEGIMVGFNFFYNPPGQTLKDFLSLVSFYIKAKIILRKKLRGISLSSIRIEPKTPLLDLAISQGEISQNTDLLPMDHNSLEKLFYINPRTKFITKIMRASYNILKRLRKDRIET